MSWTKRVLNVILSILWNLYNNMTINKKNKKAPLKVKIAKLGILFLQKDTCDFLSLFFPLIW